MVSEPSLTAVDGSPARRWRRSATNEGRGSVAAIGMRTAKGSGHRRGWYVVLACLLTACSDGDQASEVTTATSDRAAVEVTSTAVASDERVVAAIEGFDVAEPANVGSRAALTIMILTEPESTRATAKNLVGSDDPDVRLAAIYALSITLSSVDVDALSPILESIDPRERVLAAAGLLAVGDARAVPVLIASLEDETPIALGFPPVHVWERARVALLQATGEDFGLSEAATATAAAATIPDWEAWWAGAEADFHVVPAADPFGS
jgi:HEAT repeat protein